MQEPPKDRIEDMEADKDAYRQVKRDWVTLLAPALLSAATTCGVGAYFAGQVAQRVTQLQVDVDYIKHDYVPRAEIEKQTDTTKHTIERIDDKLDRIYDKLDRREK